MSRATTAVQRLVGNAVALALGAALSLALAETALRWRRFPIPERLSHRLFSCYESGPHQIAFDEPLTEVRLHKARFQTTCRFGKHEWHHRGDRWGFRNPEDYERVDVVLLGDSFIYGHGVEETATVAHYLRHLTGLRVANLGITAGSPVEYVMYLRNFALRLSPRIVLAMVFANDVLDVPSKRTEDAVREFVTAGRAPELAILEPEALFAGAPLESAWLESWSLTYRAADHYWHRLKRGPELNLDPVEVWLRENRRRPHGDAPREEDAGPLDGIVYTRKAARVMADSARAARVELVLGYIPVRRRLDPFLDPAMQLLVGNLARENGIPFLDLTPSVTREDGTLVPGDRLPDDGHFSAQGAERAARAIARFLRESKLIESTSSNPPDPR